MNIFRVTHADGMIDNIEGDYAVVIKPTGQTIIYGNGCMRSIVAVVPPTSFIKRLPEGNNLPEFKDPPPPPDRTAVCSNMTNITL